MKIGLGHVKVDIIANPEITVKKNVAVDISLNLTLTSAVRRARGIIPEKGDHGMENMILFETITLKI